MSLTVPHVPVSKLENIIFTFYKKMTPFAT